MQCLSLCLHAEMKLNSQDVWGHFAPMFHLVDVFAIYAITLVGGRHAMLPSFSAQEALLAIGEDVALHAFVCITICVACMCCSAAMLGSMQQP